MTWMLEAGRGRKRGSQVAFLRLSARLGVQLVTSGNLGSLVPPQSPAQHWEAEEGGSVCAEAQPALGRWSLSPSQVRPFISRG